MRIVALIPLLDTHSIPSIILKNIVSQTIEIEILPITRPISEESKKIGWNTTTAGSIIAKKFNCSSTDPHSFITKNRMNRCTLISNTIIGLIGEYEKHISICTEILQNFKEISPNCDKDMKFMESFYKMYTTENKYSGYRKLTSDEIAELEELF